MLNVISTGSSYDGKIFVSDNTESYEIGTKAAGDAALQGSLYGLSLSSGSVESNLNNPTGAPLGKMDSYDKLCTSRNSVL